MRLTPRRDGNPRGLFRALYLASLAALLAVAATAEASEKPLFFALVAAEGLLMGALFLWLASFPERLFYELQGPFLEVHHPLGKRQVHRSEVRPQASRPTPCPSSPSDPKPRCPATTGCASA